MILPWKIIVNWKVEFNLAYVNKVEQNWSFAQGFPNSFKR